MNEERVAFGKPLEMIDKPGFVGGGQVVFGANQRSG
jgi:hypothetical protein